MQPFTSGWPVAPGVTAVRVQRLWFAEWAATRQWLLHVECVAALMRQVSLGRRGLSLDQRDRSRRRRKSCR